MNAPHAISPAELRESAYAAFCARDWDKARRLNAVARKLEAQRAYERAEKVHGRYSAEGLAAYREYRIATTNLLRLEIGR